MKTKFSALIICVIALCVFSSCASKTPIEKAKEFAENIHSASYNMNIVVGVDDAEDDIYNVITNGNIDFVKEKGDFHLDLAVELGTFVEFDTEIYAISDSDKLKVYTGMMDSWEYSEENLSSYRQYNIFENMPLYLDAISSYEEIGTEKVNDFSAKKFSCTLDSSYLENILLSTNSLGQLEETGLSREEITELFSQLNDVQMELYLEDKSFAPVKYSFNLTDAIKGVLEKLVENGEENDNIVNFEVSLDVVSFNSFEGITVPEEVLEAVGQ